MASIPLQLLFFPFHEEKDPQHINECFKCYEKIWLLAEVETITPLIM
jgi:hypothetical protein